MNHQNQNEYTSSGNLVVSVSTASGAIPVEGAIVTVRGGDMENSGVITVMYTDRSGNTERITLPAPPASLSEAPGNISPYARYNLEIDKEGFNTRTFINVPIFSGTTSIQPVNLIPRTEFEGQAIIPNDGTVTENQNPEL
ncbi:MAG: hypothetical protein IJ002_06040 [Clostridia bacterium]|nr:hypothetical protein [Clostridia bacterium]